MTRAERRAAAHARIARHAEQLAQLAQTSQVPTEGSILGEPIHNRVVRVTRAGDGARAGRGRWSQVSTRDAHTPPETLRNLSPIAGTQHGEGTVRVITSDGRVRIAQASEFRRPRQASQVRRVAQATRHDAGSDYAARLAQLGATGDVD